MSEMNGNGLSRRQWLKAVGSTALGATALGTVLSSCARGNDQAIAPLASRKKTDNKPFDADTIIAALPPAEVNCVGCGRCMPCRFGVNIPGMYSAWNEAIKAGEIPIARDELANGGGVDRAKAFVARIEKELGDKHLAHRCAGCGACDRVCPIHLPIATQMRSIGKFIDLTRESL